MPDRFSTGARVERAAADWTLRITEGLSPQHEVEFAEWLAADPRHAATFEEHRRAWTRFAPLAAQAADASRPATDAARPARFRWTVPVLASAAAVAIGLALWQPSAETSSTRPVAPVRLAAHLPTLCERRTLPDGTLVELNRDSQIELDFTRGERRVRLLQGEAHFAVAHNPERPFVVDAGHVEARALGTAFNVRLAALAVEVLVTEGTVEVTRERAPTARPNVAPEASLRATYAARESGAEPTLVRLTARQHVVVAPERAMDVLTLSPADIERALAWQPKLLEFDDVPLSAIVAEFNRRNPLQLVVADPALAARRMTTTFRSDNVAGFVRLIESNYAILAVPRDGTVVELQVR